MPIIKVTRVIEAAITAFHAPHALNDMWNAIRLDLGTERRSRNHQPTGPLCTSRGSPSKFSFYTGTVIVPRRGSEELLSAGRATLALRRRAVRGQRSRKRTLERFQVLGLFLLFEVLVKLRRSVEWVCRDLLCAVDKSRDRSNRLSNCIFDKNVRRRINDVVSTSKDELDVDLIST
jgi:hypothetical protein